jgi:transposase
MSKRRKWSADEKLRIVLAGMQPGVEVSDQCRQEGINPTMYYYWKNKLLSSAKRVFDEKEGRPSAQEEKKVAEVEGGGMGAGLVARVAKAGAAV